MTCRACVKTRDNRDPEEIIKELQAAVEALRAARKPVDPLQAFRVDDC